MKLQSPRSRHGFTLVEIMVAVAIVGMLAMIAWPAYSRISRRTHNVTFMNDVRTFANAADTYIFEQGNYPQTSAPGQIPTGFGDYISTGVWKKPTPLGGGWFFEKDGTDAMSAFGVANYTVPASQIQEIDSTFDDGDLGTGNLRQSSGGYVWIVAE